MTPILLPVLQFAVGVVMLLAAPWLSRRYNAWTTQFRERNPNINPPPTDAMRALNTKIMTTLFRVFGVGLILMSAFEVLPMFRRN